MLKSVIENYLTSIKEIQFFHPFINLLENLGFYNIHLTHGANEFGKDIIAKRGKDQYVFVIKVGNINSQLYRNEVKGQILESQTNSLSHPDFMGPPKMIYLVTTGKTSSSVDLSLQNYCSYSKERSLPSVELWSRDYLVKEFTKTGIESFFNLHKDPEFISDFFDTYTKIIKNEQFQSFDIERKTKKWLLLDLSNSINRLQVFFEAYYFSKLLIQKGRNYEALLFLTALVRALSSRNLLEGNAEIIKSYILEIVNTSPYLGRNVDFKKKINQMEGLFDIVYYPERCIEMAELLSISILLENNKKLEKSFKTCMEEKGCYKPISDNFGISVFLISLAMLKLDKKKELSIYLVNCTVWICDRYESLGIAPIGSTKEKEYEQLLSEFLSSFNNSENKFSFLATIILDICFYLNDNLLFEQIANEFKSVEITPIHYHINELNNIWGYSNITSEHDPEFSPNLNLGFTTMSKKYFKNDNFVENLSELELLCSIFLLRDRYYPFSIFNKILSN